MTGEEKKGKILSCRHAKYKNKDNKRVECIDQHERES